MKIQNISDVDKFFKVIDECKGTVELVSPEGDRINLVAHDREDIERLIKYMYQGE